MLRWYTALVCALLLVGCAAGGRQSATPAVVSSAGAARAHAQLTIKIPLPSSTHAGTRAAAYVSSSTHSIAIAVTDGGVPVSGFPMTANLSSGSPGCTAAPPLLVCNVALTVPPGSLVASFTTYDGTNATGSVLSQAQNLPLTIVEGQPNVIPLILGGVPASISVQATGGSAGGATGLGFTVAGNGTGTLTVSALDAEAT